MKTYGDLSDRARRAIEKHETVCYDVAAEHSQIVENVAHMRWFREAVMEQIAADVKAYNHLLMDGGGIIRPDMPWCEPCKSYHVKPRNREHHLKLQCFAKWEEK